MDRTGTRLKNPSGWFAAGREVARALPLLSDGAFKLYIYFCLHAERSTGQLRVDQRSLAKALDKSRRSIITHLHELCRLEVCEFRPAMNQHTGGQIEVCDPFWPYEKVDRQESGGSELDYVKRLQLLFGSRSCVVNSLTAADERLAGAWFRQKIPFDQIERAFLLGCARKYIALLNGQISGPIVSLNYFSGLIEEVARLETSPNYWQYLKQRVDRLEQQLAAKGTAIVAGKDSLRPGEKVT
jgi:hypothetical protein